MLNRLIGVVLTLGVIVVGVHAVDPDLDFTKTMPPIHITHQQEHSSPASHPYEVARPILNLGFSDFPCPPTKQITKTRIVIDDKPLTKAETLAVVPLIAHVPTVDAVKAKRIIADHVNKLSAIKKRYTGHTISTKTKVKLRQTIFTKMKDAHVYKFIVSHHHKSKTHHHHSGGHHHHHHGGHHHSSGPQKISAHGPPTHLTGCGP